MPNFQSMITAPSVRLLDVGRSSNLDGWSGAMGVLWRGLAHRGGPKVFVLGAVANCGSRVSLESPGFGTQCLWERVLVFPRSKNFSVLLSDAVYPTEVWNACRNKAQTLDTLSQTGDTGVSVVGPSSMRFEPWQSQSYIVTVTGRGASSLTAIITWSFTGITGAEQALTGSRLVCFSLRPDWSEPFREGVSYLTSILTGYSGAEQRMKLRTTPRYSASFRVLTTTQRETAFLEGLLLGWQGRDYGVPWWPEMIILQSDVASGSTTLPVETADRPSYKVGGLVILWSDAYTWEAATIESITTGSITIATALTSSWSVGTRIVPLRRGRIVDDQSLGRPTNWLTADAFTFTCEGV